MKKYKVLTAVLMGLTLVFFTIRCQHEDGEAIPIVGPDPIEHGTAIIACTTCNTVPGGSGVWYHDKSHSNVMWETRYKEFGSLLTGRFNEFFMESLNWDEGVPANISFQGYVRLNTVNTGEPNRDTGCLLTSFGTAAGLVDEANNKAILKSIAGTGKYSTSDAGFLVDADFTFLGITKTVTLKIFFAPQYDAGTTFGAGLNSEFEISKADFLPNDTNIGNKIVIKINNTLKNKK